MPRKPKKERLPFWKSEKLPPEVRSLFAHIGKAADNMTSAQWSELILNGGLAGLSAYSFAPRLRRASYQVTSEARAPSGGAYGGTSEIRRLTDPEAQALRDQGSYVYELNNPPPSTDIVWDFSVVPNAFVGPIGLKLATTMGGTPPVSQIAGLIILSMLGLASMSGLGILPSAAENLKTWHATDWTGLGLSQAFKDAIKKDPVHFGI